MRLEEQPKCIKGGRMREYQLEGLNWLLEMHGRQHNVSVSPELLRHSTQRKAVLNRRQHYLSVPAQRLAGMLDRETALRLPQRRQYHLPVAPQSFAGILEAAWVFPHGRQHDVLVPRRRENTLQRLVLRKL